ncbi:hypothetical protein [Halobellus rarus]|uniref:Secreted protein n=1 Tax=Halobellus rarus TaxID=1126237 RepID=A0ABD6CRV7_9EURY|nr:hypothetical protein [Halobellus rarus]
MFGTQVRLVNDALLQMILTAWLVTVGLVLADTARGDVLVAVPVLVIDAFGAICGTDWAITGATTEVVIGTETLLTVDTVCAV